MNVNSTNSTSYTNPYDMYKYYTRVGGLASGLDTDSIIQGLMSVEKTKYNKLYQQKQAFRVAKTGLYGYGKCYIKF